MKLRSLAAAALLCLCAWPAMAANKAFISEYAALGTARGDIPQIAQEPALTDQTPVDFSGGAAQSAAFGSGTKFIRILCDTRCAVLFGANPTATTNNKPLVAGSAEYFGVLAGQKVSVIASP
jgi:hypothetical protein